jgi:hypothetical protein
MKLRLFSGLAMPVAVLGAACGAPQLDASDHAEIALDQAKVKATLVQCEELGKRVGKDAGGYAAYVACREDAGLYLDGGAR